MLGMIEGRRRRGQHRMRWLDSITDSMDTNLSKLQEIVEDGGSLACCSPWGHKESNTTYRLNNNMVIFLKVNCVRHLEEFSFQRKKSGRKRLWLAPDKELTFTLSTRSCCLLSAFNPKVGWPREEQMTMRDEGQGQGMSSVCKLCDQSPYHHTQRQHPQDQLCPASFFFLI